MGVGLSDRRLAACVALALLGVAVLVSVAYLLCAPRTREGTAPSGGEPSTPSGESRPTVGRRLTGSTPPAQEAPAPSPPADEPAGLPRKIRGVVLWPDSHARVPAEICVTSESGSDVQVLAEVGSDGRFEVDADAMYANRTDPCLRARTRDRSLVSATHRVAGSVEADLPSVVLRLRSSAEVRGRLVASEGSLIADGEVLVHEWSNWDLYRRGEGRLAAAPSYRVVRTDTTGRFQALVRPGTVSVYPCVASGNCGPETRLEARPGVPVDAGDLLASWPSQEFRLRVADAGGAAVPGAGIRLEQGVWARPDGKPGLRGGFHLRTDEAGEAAVRIPLNALPTPIAVGKQGFEVESLVLAPGLRQTVLVTLRRSPGIAFRLVVPPGFPPVESLGLRARLLPLRASEGDPINDVTASGPSRLAMARLSQSRLSRTGPNTYEVTSRSAGLHRLEVTLRGGVAISRVIDVTTAASRPLELIEIPPCRVVRFSQVPHPERLDIAGIRRVKLEWMPASRVDEGGFARSVSWADLREAAFVVPEGALSMEIRASARYPLTDWTAGPFAVGPGTSPVVSLSEFEKSFRLSGLHAETTIAVLLEGGEPLAIEGLEVEVGSLGTGTPGATIQRTDHAGRIRVQLRPGPYQCRLRGGPSGAWVGFRVETRPLQVQLTAR